jgi:DNA invertase Pin-like site-specific DNA recombinase
LADIREWILKINPQAEILEFRDDDKSGKTIKRPGLLAALEEMGKGDILVVRDWDRLARNLDVQMKVVRLADRKKVQLHAVYGGAWRNVDDPMIEMVSQILAVIAEMQRKVISRKTSEKMLKHQAAGRCMGSKPPFGYAIKVKLVGTEAKKFLVEVPAEQAAIRRMVSAKEQGFTNQQIANILQAEGHRLKGVKIWNLPLIAKVLKREAAKQSG